MTTNSLSSKGSPFPLSLNLGTKIVLGLPSADFKIDKLSSLGTQWLHCVMSKSKERPHGGKSRCSAQQP